jgi:predicted CXXCH cytochrome family protein
VSSHVWRPFYVVLAFVALLLVFRHFYVPRDFGSGKLGFMYSYHRKSNEGEWKNQPSKYGISGREKMHEFCQDCHSQEVSIRSEKLHGIIPCENCHGPVLNHPEAPEKLIVDLSRELCLRCHTSLPYTTSERKRIPGIAPLGHYPQETCVRCHNPHNPKLEAGK